MPREALCFVHPDIVYKIQCDLPHHPPSHHPQSPPRHWEQGFTCVGCFENNVDEREKVGSERWNVWGILGYFHRAPQRGRKSASPARQ